MGALSISGTTEEPQSSSRLVAMQPTFMPVQLGLDSGLGIWQKICKQVGGGRANGNSRYPELIEIKSGASHGWGVKMAVYFSEMQRRHWC